ncbi:hypothetical protein EIP91_001594 [Steccherinum ochraceum]|uniref:Cytochrome P450 n=1 Tax=Steccherinum ochraceum TaxID=92696 RepID=A0A4R0RK24_9APHY|nr:hypothetical protein EIP91_001594 [Steccherinum ochraceum]
MAYVIALVIVAFATWYLSNRLRRARLLLPPGPKPLPIIGCMLDLPSEKPWITYSEWSSMYNPDLVYIDLPMHPAVIIGSYTAAMDLLDKRSGIYSDRSPKVMYELTSWDYNTALMPYGQKWRTHRRVFHQHFHLGAVDVYRPVQLAVARRFLSWVLDMPEQSRRHVRQMTSTIIYRITYGKTIASMNHEYFIAAEKAVAGASMVSIPGAYWVEFFPFLKHIPSWVPGAKFRQVAEEILGHVINIRDKPFDEVREEFSKGTAPPSLAKILLEEVQAKHGTSSDFAFHEEVARNVAGIAYIAGADTTMAAAASATLALGMHPEIQQKAQAMLDELVGPNRLPDFDDIQQIPYIRAIVMEACRWMPPLPFLIPRVSLVDDEYKGYHIPKGCTLLPNVWAMSHNPEYYAEPDRFNPDRYFDKDGNIDPDVLDPTMLTQYWPFALLCNDYDQVLPYYWLVVCGFAEGGIKLSCDIPEAFGIIDPMAYATVLLVIGLITWYLSHKLRRTQPPLPPGPTPLPIIGNMLGMPTQRPWVAYSEWSTVYKSDMIYISLPLQPTIIVGSYKIARELFDRRSGIYSDRIPLVMDELTTWDFSTAFMPYGLWWRAHRRMFHEHFHSGAVDVYLPVQLAVARKFLLWVLENPKQTRKHVRQYGLTATIIYRVTYGKTITNMDHEYIVAAEKAVGALSMTAVPGAYWVEYFPFMKHIPSWMPGAKFKKVAEEIRSHVVSMRDKPYDDAKAEFSKGSAPASLARTLIEEVQGKYDEHPEAAYYDEVAKNVTGLAYAAGADTTMAAAVSVMLALALYPDVQRKAQALLDEVVGPDRLPDFDDLQELPYIRAIIMEAFRWMPPLPFVVPRASLVDDEYNGYHIPKGCTLIPNIWRMLRNPEDYPDPERFNPDRFIDKDGKIDPNVLDPALLIFGFGRRFPTSICSGRHFAMNTLDIYVASTLHVFDISAGVDANGVPVVLTSEYVGGMISGPRDFPTGFKPRSETALRLIREAKDSDIP